ncbi:transport system kinase [Microlunatus phosphovorus NM-1]|uniref:Transport system kinase n=1 Tax=Microlunatus phosphovorus (strain ATCC 700054 / DSM 10555 / JCM 9379 / NBRC 101784 / NCIMB 13414 / VKM Ac-1990 / NM-1) TaxID=1032480 RepID=F5XKD6_MICPN|nr:methylmalonyl Co-A mutase-associated GTPase MeaB [Microlunatus phosphovorus]BAK36008.1 transport system kinase [Microlunatus phosphovorus NM-1]
MSRPSETGRLDQLIGEARTGRPRAIGRLISLVENQAPELPALMATLAPDTGRARVIGLTGAPGVGKSTTVAALVTELRQRGQRVAVLAVDPSSPFSGGALLGDRVRMQQHALDDGVFIRSMATRGHLGGLAVAAPQAIRVLDAAGFDLVLVETVGVGQSEVEVAEQVDVTLVLLAPGMGDGVQAAKAGVLEIGDVFVVNKADRDGAHAVVRELRNMVALTQRTPADWKPPVVSIVAVDGTGIIELLAELDRFFAQAAASGLTARRRLARARREVESLVLARLRAAVPTQGRDGLDALATAVANGRLDAYTAADRLLVSTPSGSTTA